MTIVKPIFLLMIFMLVSCNGIIPEEDPSITDSDLLAQGKILLMPASVDVIFPITNPGFVDQPIIRVSGVRQGSIVNLYISKHCDYPIANVMAVGSTIDITVPKITEGTYTFYADQSNEFTKSKCTNNPEQYQYQSSILTPSTIELISPSSSPNLSQTPIFKVYGIESGSVVTLYTDDYCSNSVASATAIGSSVEIPIASLLPGTYTFYATQTNSIGKKSECSTNSVDYQVVSLLAPPSSVTLANPAISPSSNKKPSFNVGGVFSSYKVSIYRDPNCIMELGQATSLSGTVEVQVPFDLQDGIYQIYARQEDTVGNSSECSTSFQTYNLDSSTSDFNDVQLVSPTSSPGSDSTPTFQVKGAETNALVFLFSDSNCTTVRGSGNANSTGTVNITSSTLTEGVHTFYGKQTDQTGNTSVCIGPLITYNYDITVTTPTGIDRYSPLDASSADDTPTFSVIGVEDGASVRLYKDSICNVQVGAAVASATSVYVTTNQLPIGSYTFYSKQIDAAGNTSSCSTASVAYTVTTALVAEPTEITLVTPTTSPNIILTPVINVSGLISGGTLFLYSDHLCSGGNLLSTTVVTSTSANVNIAELSVGTHVFYAKQANTSGGLSNCSNNYLTYEIDLSATKPTSLSLSDPVSSPSSDVTPIIEVQGVEVGATVSLYSDNSCFNSIGSIVSTSTVALVTASITYSGDYTFYSKQVDSFGNISGCSDAFVNYTLEVTGTTPSALTLITPAVAFGNNTTPLIEVDGVSIGSEVFIYTDLACSNLIGQMVSTQTSVQILVNTLTSGDGEYNFYAKQRDSLGNFSSCTTDALEYNLDTQASAPTILSLVDPTITPSFDQTPKIKIEGVEQSSNVTIYSNNTCSIEVGNGVTSESSVDLEITLITLAEGVYTFYAKQVDPSGNLSSCSTASVSYEVITSSSAPTSIVLISPLNSNSTVTTPVIQVAPTDTGSTGKLYTASNCNAGSEVGSASATGSSVNITATLTQGSHTIYAQVTSPLAVVSDCSSVSLAYNVLSTISDVLFPVQWFLENSGQMGASNVGEDINVIGVWESNKGTGVHVRIVDDGLQLSHPDLSANIEPGASINVFGGTDPTPSGTDNHGTSCSGVVAARDNTIGGRGVAPRATLSGYNLLQNFTDANQALAMSYNASSVDVSSNSWGPPDNQGTFDMPATSWENAIETGLSSGRDGKGIVYVWAAGNGATSGDNSNYDGFANYYGVMSICGVEYTGAFADYSEAGANLWVCAPTADQNLLHGIVTTDLTGNNGFNPTTAASWGVPDLGDTDYTQNFNGTSASAPIVSGVVALVLAENTSLSWRDVKVILAKSARKNDPTNLKNDTNTWAVNGAGYNVNQNYGFGVVNAEAAVNLASTWSNVGTAQTDIGSASPSATLANGANSPTNSAITISGSNVTKIEYIEVTLNASHNDWGNLSVVLSKSGSTISSVLAKSHSCATGNCTVSANTFRFGTSRHLGESPNATWTLSVEDKEADGNQGSFTSWQIKFYGE
jgi:proprotein convertase subtilisin/kexin type 2